MLYPRGLFLPSNGLHSFFPFLSQRLTLKHTSPQKPYFHKLESSLAWRRLDYIPEDKLGLQSDWIDLSSLVTLPAKKNFSPLNSSAVLDKGFFFPVDPASPFVRPPEASQPFHRPFLDDNLAFPNSFSRRRPLFKKSSTPGASIGLSFWGEAPAPRRKAILMRPKPKPKAKAPKRRKNAKVVEVTPLFKLRRRVPGPQKPAHFTPWGSSPFSPLASKLKAPRFNQSLEPSLPMINDTTFTLPTFIPQTRFKPGISTQ